MISVTMDLMDMSELPACSPDLSSTLAQAPPVTSLTDITDFSVPPQPAGEYFDSVLSVLVLFTQ